MVGTNAEMAEKIREAWVSKGPDEAPCEGPVEAIWWVLEDANERLRENLTKYGDPKGNFVILTAILNALGFKRLRPGSKVACRDLSEFDVALFMLSLKIMRLSQAGMKDNDSLVDIAGYAACLGSLQDPPAPHDFSI